MPFLASPNIKINDIRGALLRKCSLLTHLLLELAHGLASWQARDLLHQLGPGLLWVWWEWDNFYKAFLETQCVKWTRHWTKCRWPGFYLLLKLPCRVLNSVSLLSLFSRLSKEGVRRIVQIVLFWLSDLWDVACFMPSVASLSESPVRRDTLTSTCLSS
jgi:hypothetical protein